MAKNIVFIDTEVGITDKKIHDLAALNANGSFYHGPSIGDFCAFINTDDFVCGHNIIHHDLKYLENAANKKFTNEAIDTLYLSPLLFPKHPYHALLKDDKLQNDDLNNPLSDCKKAQNLFYDEINAFNALPFVMQQIFYGLLHDKPEFSGFFRYVYFSFAAYKTADLIKNEFKGKICANAGLDAIIENYPVELAYALALIYADDRQSLTPPWLMRNFPEIENVIKLLRNTPCQHGCAYCQSKLDVHKGLKEIFGYDEFRTFNGEPLQEKAAQAAVEGRSVLAVFPTGGGKSITFQLPALMAGQTVHGLTVVISPLLSLMKDQVDNLYSSGIVEAVTINGLLSPIERAEALARVADGSANIMYIAPESLRSRTIEKLLLGRNIVRIVIDEAHCFSAWGQDFRVDYLYIGEFIRELQNKKGTKKAIPVSCFTATAKPKVISDICEYFKKKLDLNLEIFASAATRENLHYTVLYKETDDEKYNALRRLLEQKNCPTIVYVSRTKRTYTLADKLNKDGFSACPFNGKMDSDAKIANQEAFINNEIQVIVATSAFGMGVDKKDVKLVVHYDISGSLEDYVQEAGRAGRDPAMQADCYVLYNDNDLDKHFILLNQTKLSISEIQQVWKGIKDIGGRRRRFCCSPLEIARQAGWDNAAGDVEMRVKTAVAALENAGYIKRGKNMPRVFATSILAENMADAAKCIDSSPLFDEAQRLTAKRIIKSLISSRSIAKAGNDEAESRVDYLADILGLTKEEVISSVNLMRQAGLLDDMQDMSAYIMASDKENKASLILERFAKLELFLLGSLKDGICEVNLKELNEDAQQQGVPFASVKNIRTLINYYTIKKYIQKVERKSTQNIEIALLIGNEILKSKLDTRLVLCRFILKNLYAKAALPMYKDMDIKPVVFSLIGLFKSYKEYQQQDLMAQEATLKDVEDALLYLSNIGALKLEGGFLVLYNSMEITRCEMDNKIKYKKDDYRYLDEFYKQKIQQIHIVGEYANLMVRDYNAALQFVQDYFQIDFKKFIAKYFRGERAAEITRNITPQKYNQLFGELSAVQSQIINDADSKYIVVAAGPGSGKTRVLVHKLAALILLEDVKYEQLLMLTFSRAAATEFKKRLIGLIGNAANYVEIKTFHSYCFDLLGKIGSLENSEDVVKNAVELIRSGGVEPGKISKTVLVIDEAQDMDANEFSLVSELMQNNDNMRLIAVGDDDQNIYEFRGADSRYLKSLIKDYGAAKYEMVENYRSKPAIVNFSNAFVKNIHNRMKSALIHSVQNGGGKVVVTHHSCRHMEAALIRQILKTRGSSKCCVLTNTNDEALQIVGMLLKNGVKAKLIQSVDGFKLYNLAEIRFFLKQIVGAGLQSPVIPEAVWNNAKQELFNKYSGSNCFEICRNLLHDFETINAPDKSDAAVEHNRAGKYFSDLEEFIKESNYEDFYDDEKETVYVSTIHKAKGREFDTVYMLLNNERAATDEQKRKLYVGMTRAKNELYIHCNTGLFNGYNMPGVQHVYDKNVYAEPEEISLQLTHRDVFLDFYKDKKMLIFRLQSGSNLQVTGNYLAAEFDRQKIPVAKFSKAFAEKLNNLQQRSYKPYAAKIRFIVAWKGKEDEEETAVILPDIYLRKTGKKNYRK